MNSLPWWMDLFPSDCIIEPMNRNQSFSIPECLLRNGAVLILAQNMSDPYVIFLLHLSTVLTNHLLQRITTD